MDSQSYNDWVSIFNEQFQPVWKQERTELRKLSMIYHAFQLELDRLKEHLSEEMVTIRSDLKKKDFAEKRKRFAGLAQSEKYDIEFTNKENESTQNCTERETEDFFIEPSSDKMPHEAELTKACKLLPNISVFTDSPILHKTSFRREKRKKSCSPPSLSLKTPEQGDKNVDDSNILEASIIEDTPEIKIHRSSRHSRLQLKRPAESKPNKHNQSTLTQMFFKPKKLKKHIDSELPSMTVSEMINLVNESNSEESDAESDATVDDLQVPSPTQKSLKCDESSTKTPNAEPLIVYEEVVRGKERQKLKGWSCNDCKEYYEGLNLPLEELQKKQDECSRHRNRFKPRQETYDGFWDLTFGPTPPVQGEQSMVLNYKKM